MSAKIARGGGSGRARPKSQARGGKGSARKGAAPAGQLSEAVRRVSWWIFLGMLAVLAIATVAALKVPQLLGTGLGEAIGSAGFSVKHVEIKGADKVPQLQVYNIAFDQPTAAMPLIDVEATRQRLLKFGWVRDARVSRRFPDTLVVDIVERRPAAIWQNNQQLALIDIEGVVLEAVRLEAMPDLPIVIGPAANLRASELARLTAAAPQLKPMMAGATLVGGRRWDIRFQSGETLALPEGEQAAKKALIRFARMDQANPLLSRGFVRFDMRIEDKFVVRVSDKPGSSVPALAPDAPPATPAPATTADVDAAVVI
ncbi:MAG TPA: cell division protein FtsQ/DivIB [Allosphingosinicella sp.]|nr:cell division protein FtsQ/DivIB [Allosphingosinicella sp.]